MRSIIVVPIAPIATEGLAGVVSRLEEVFQLPVTVDSLHTIDSAYAFDGSRNQYYSSLLLSGLLRMFPAHDGKVLGIIGADLYIPVLTYVFGEAQLDGTAAIISTYRLDDTMYGLPPNRSLLDERVLKEAVHELGHTFGLVHCGNFTCVMHSSTEIGRAHV